MSAITGLEDALQGLDNDKQDNINDLNFIRDGANKGNTAVQPSQLSVYRTAELQDQIDELLVDAINSKQPLLTEYLKSASVSGNTLNLVKHDGTTIPFTPQGGGGGNTSFELINEITLDESSSAIRIDKDVNNNAFTLNRAILFIFLPTTNDGAEHNFYFQSTTYPYISFGGISGGKTTIVIEAEKNGFIRATRYQYGRDFNAQRIIPSAGSGNDGKMPENITVVRTANFSGNVFPVGTVFKLMGVRA